MEHSVSLRKHGTGEVILDDDDAQTVHKTASSEPREQALAEVIKEQQEADQPEGQG